MGWAKYLEDIERSKVEIYKLQASLNTPELVSNATKGDLKTILNRVSVSLQSFSDLLNEVEETLTDPKADLAIDNINLRQEISEVRKHFANHSFSDDDVKVMEDKFRQASLSIKLDFEDKIRQIKEDHKKELKAQLQNFQNANRKKN